MSHVVDEARALGRLEGAIEDGEVLVLDVRRAFDGAGRVNVADDRVGLLVRVAELEQRGWHRLVDDLDHTAAHQLLVLDQRQVRLDAGRVAVHHEADGAGWREHRDLRVAVAELLAVCERFVPALLRGFINSRRHVGLVDVVYRGAMHADDIEKRLAVDVPARTSSARHSCRASLGLADGDVRRSVGNAGTKIRLGEALPCRLRRGYQRFAQFGDPRGLQVRLPTHDGGYAGCV